jgi:cysteinyl-tRNA synthetase
MIENILSLYDSYSEKNTPINEKFVKIYCCGPTVYNHVHIGNLRPLITFDILVKFLLATGHKVKYVSNITDVDDKIINKAREEKISEKQLSKKYEKHYFDLAKKLNVRKMDSVPKVMENIDGIIKYVEKLVKKNKGYISEDGDAYFDINTVKKIYGKLSKQNINELLKGVRKENKSDKHSPLDFVL